MVKKLFIGTALSVFMVISTNAVEPDLENKVVQIGESSAKELLKTLKSSLMKAMSEGTVYDAVKFCSKKAIPLTKQVERKIDHGIKIKRTSLKYRNPKNAPDEYEKKALIYFEQVLKKKGKLPPYLIQELNENGKKYYRYYKPLKVGTLCLTCHGEPDKMDQKLLKIIKERYPEDKATGYKLGDFRGVVRVSIPENLVKDH